MVLEILVMDWDRHKTVAELSQLMSDETDVEMYE
jgi:hypothetical protein